MTLSDAFSKIVEILKTTQNGEIRLIIRKGEVKHVNVLREYVPENDEKQ